MTAIKQPKQPTKSFSPTQVKALILRLEEEGAAIINAPYERNRTRECEQSEQRKAAYSKLMASWCHAPKPQRDAIVSVLTEKRYDEDSPLHIDKLVPLKGREPTPLPHYSRKLVWHRGVSRNMSDGSHPLSKMLKEMEFDLIMQGVGDVESAVSSFRKRLEHEMQGKQEK